MTTPTANDEDFVMVSSEDVPPQEELEAQMSSSSDILGSEDVDGSSSDVVKTKPVVDVNVCARNE